MTFREHLASPPTNGLLMPTVDYGLIADDYGFFLAHSTETGAQLAALQPHIEWLARLGRSVSMLDFGCGAGAFIEQLLRQTPVPRLALACVEPVEEQRNAAVKRLSPLVESIRDDRGPFDLVLANHSLYYLDDFAVGIETLANQLAPSGRLIVALLNRQNTLAALWQAGYQLAGKPFPFPLAEDAERVLYDLGLLVGRDLITYEVAFEDTLPNRARIVRFLFGSDVETLGELRLVRLFDSLSKGGEIRFRTAYPHIVATNGFTRQISPTPQ